MFSAARRGLPCFVIAMSLLACGEDRRGGASGTEGAGFGGFGAVGGTSGVGGTGGVAGSGAFGATDAGVDAMLSDASVSDAFVSDGGLPPADAGLDARVPDAAVAPSEPAYWELFSADAFPTFEITLPPESVTALTDDGEIYQPGTLRYGAIEIQNVGVRIKGRASLQGFDEKPSFKIKMNEFVSGQRLLGLKRLTLNNMVQDPSMVRERLGYTVFRAAGVPAPLCNHARVYVNGEYYGLYANVQSLDEVFVGEHWTPSPGNLYDITNAEYHIDFERERPSFLNANPAPTETKFELETNKAINDTSDLTALIDAVSVSANRDFLTEVEAVLDLDEVLAMGAVQAVISDWDGYFGARNNYKAYHELSQDRFLLFPWGIDQTFGIQDDVYSKLDYRIDHSNSERSRCLIYDRCEANVTCRARYNEQVALAVAVFEDLDLLAQLQVILDQVDQAAMEDTRKPYSDMTRQTSIEDLHDFLTKRAALVRAQLP